MLNGRHKVQDQTADASNQSSTSTQIVVVFAQLRGKNFRVKKLKKASSNFKTSIRTNCRKSWIPPIEQLSQVVFQSLILLSSEADSAAWSPSCHTPELATRSSIGEFNACATQITSITRTKRLHYLPPCPWAITSQAQSGKFHSTDGSLSNTWYTKHKGLQELISAGETYRAFGSIGVVPDPPAAPHVSREHGEM